ncbi:MAG: radical SAM family heme chaperone HemW [Clostridiales bacterium]|nr:radical SAM family heme chaperone HemW [Clostridiales bacterium]
MLLYIHYPFCKERCAYCDFFSSRICDEKTQRDYVKALETEFDSHSLNEKIETIYFGGGTPSALYNGAIRDTASFIFKKVDRNIGEFTVECNPESINKEKLTEYKNVGANRLSIGVQSLNDSILKIIGRLHDSASAINKIKLALEYFDNVSVDMMTGLPNQTIKDLEYTIDIISKLNISHISCYELKVENGTKLERMIKQGEIKLPNDDESADLFDFAIERLKQNGFERYEISNFCRDGKKSKHNMGYWQRKNYIGLGAGAHSLNDNIRYMNKPDINAYLSNPLSQKQILEKLGEKDKIYEEIILGLRLADGLDIKMLDYFDIPAHVMPFFSIGKSNVFLNDRGMRIMNTIISELVFKI